jgi:hypothetical protein
MQNTLKNGIHNYFIPIHTPLVQKNYNDIKITGMKKRYTYFPFTDFAYFNGLRVSLITVAIPLLDPPLQR